MKKTIKLSLAALCLIFLFPQIVWGADINITYRTEEAAKAGDKINVEIDISGSKPVTTLGLRLNYDSDKLTFEGESWSEGIKSANAMTLVSDVENDGGKALNISMISDVGYQGSGTVVTLAFSVKGDYSDVPVELQLRDVTDKDMQDVSESTNVSYQKQGGSGAVPGNGNGNGDSGNQGSHTGDKAQTSKAYKTGIDILDFKVLFLGGICLAVGCSCVIIKRKLSR